MARKPQFANQVAAYVEQYRKRLSFVAKTATLSLANDAREQGPSVANPDNSGMGRMPVDTGNLRNSMVASTEGVPSGPSTGNETKKGDDVAAELIRWQPGTTPFWAGFTARYARAMEARYGFMRGAVEKWDDFVAEAVEEAKRKKL